MDKFNLVVRAARELARAVQENYYDLSDLNIINYSEVCEWCNFPDLQDGGIYEQAIDAARYVSTIMFTVKDSEVTRGRWQEIHYSKRNGYAYIMKYGKRLYLHKFLRIY